MKTAVRATTTKKIVNLIAAKNKMMTQTATALRVFTNLSKNASSLCA